MILEDNTELEMDVINSFKSGARLISGFVERFYRSWEKHVEYLDSGNALKYI